MRYLLALDWTSHLPAGKKTTIDLQPIFVFVYTVMGIAALIFLLYGVIIYMSSRGEPARMQKGKSTIIYSVIGLVIVLLASAITIFVIGSF